MSFLNKNAIFCIRSSDIGRVVMTSQAEAALTKGPQSKCYHIKCNYVKLQTSVTAWYDNQIIGP